MYSDREILYFLQTIPGFGRRTIRCLWNHFQTGMGVFEAGEKGLKMHLKPSQLRAFLREREKQAPTERIRELQKQGIGYYSIFDWQYPKRLRMVADAPLALFVKGKAFFPSVLTNFQKCCKIEAYTKHSFSLNPPFHTDS